MPISHLEYEQKAVECLRRARVMSDNTNRALLHQMALAWIERANQIKTKSNHSESAESQLGLVSPT
jgi:hypothetical protein